MAQRQVPVAGTRAPGTEETPLDAAAFATMMRSLGPYEFEPELALAVSGGRDSMALALLADAWARDRGGAVVALTVDHGLRPNSAAEARQVRDWLAARGIAQQTLKWQGPKPRTGLQEAARKARHALLRNWCRAHGIPHLLLAHQRDDQAETFLMRLGRGSGLDGLAGIPALRGDGGVRLLRPLLSVPRTRLAATLRDRGQAWIDDPSNENPAFERARLAPTLRSLDEIGIDTRRLAEAAARAGLGRAALEREVAALAARAVEPSPAGYCRLDPAVLRAAPPDAGRALLRRLLMTVSGTEHPPRSRPLERLSTALRQGLIKGGRTLGGCRLVPWRGALVVARESRRLPEPVAMSPARPARWDRFECVLKGAAPAAGGRFQVAALGLVGWRQLKTAGVVPPGGMPAFVVRTLPSLVDRRGVVAVPHLGFRRADAVGLEFSALFGPIHPLAVVPFTVASPPDVII